MKYTISQFFTDYPDEAICLDELFQNRYGNQPYCVKCGVIDPKYHRVKKRKCYACQDCGHQLYPLAGTIFEGSTTPLTLWFFALYQFSTSKNGVSAKELQRQWALPTKQLGV